jgi:hypothetical protein
VVTASDEAYAILVSKNNMAKWIHKLSSSDPRDKKRARDDEDAARNDNVDGGPRNKKRSRDDEEKDNASARSDNVDDENVQDPSTTGDGQGDLDDSNKDIDAYYDIFDATRNRRSTEEGQTWDIGFKQYVSVAMQQENRSTDEISNQRTAGGNSDNGRQQRAIFVEEWVAL